MDNRIIIHSISIKNFRSIRRANIKTSGFNIFVGMNDAGKSNVLKALNLFFNGDVDCNTPFDYARDFSYLYPPKSKEAKAVTITIQFEVPDTFSDGGMYTWEKVWKQSGLVSNEIRNSSGEAPSSRSRVPNALRRIKYRYVPAVKSPDYYKVLLGDLYASVAASLDTTFMSSVNAFAEALGTYTQSITSDAFSKLNLSSQLTIPTDLNEIFKSLIFQTNRSKDGVQVPLTARGDGIQARHIPIILKYIANEDQKSRNQGATKITTIWGFEEPENGLELTNAFALASEFMEYSESLQIFLTTHSPAFYMKKDERGVTIFYVEKKAVDNDETIIVTGKSSQQLADAMGLMPLVAPFVAEQAEKLAAAQKIYQKNFLTDVPTILVEGETDVEYLSIAMKHLSPSLYQRVTNGELRILYKLDGAGTTQVEDWALSWLYSGFRSKLYILLDKDAAGKAARTNIINSEAYKAKYQSVSMKVCNIEPSDEIIALFSEKIDFAFEIEHLCSSSVWRKWIQSDLVDLRADAEVRSMFDGLIPRQKSLDETIDELVENADTKETILTYEPKKLKKKAMVKCLRDNFEDDASAFSGFARTIDSIEKYFGR